VLINFGTLFCFLIIYLGLGLYNNLLRESFNILLREVWITKDKLEAKFKSPELSRLFSCGDSSNPLFLLGIWVAPVVFGLWKVMYW